MVKKITGQMKANGEYGKFFPAAASPFAYNESVAYEYFPLTREEALKKGYQWKERDPRNYLKQTIVIPDKIGEVPDSVVDETLACEKCEKNYKIINPELKFYKKMGLPVPHQCPDCRHEERIRYRTDKALYGRSCDKCGTKISTSYAPDRPEKVYCESCYLKEVY